MYFDIQGLAKKQKEMRKPVATLESEPGTPKRLDMDTPRNIPSGRAPKETGKSVPPDGTARSSVMNEDAIRIPNDHRSHEKPAI